MTQLHRTVVVGIEALYGATRGIHDAIDAANAEQETHNRDRQDELDRLAIGSDRITDVRLHPD